VRHSHGEAHRGLIRTRIRSCPTCVWVGEKVVVLACSTGVGAVVSMVNQCRVVPGRMLDTRRPGSPYRSPGRDYISMNIFKWLCALPAMQ
jgi:hypothetical protein